MKKFKDTKLGEFLKDKAPKVLEIVGDVLPNTGALGIVKGILNNVSGVPDSVKTEFSEREAEFQLELAKIEKEVETAAQKELTGRLQIDMAGDSWWSKNIRPLSLVWFHLVIFILCLLDSVSWGIRVKEAWVNLFMAAYLSVLGFYFVGRTLNQWKTITEKKKLRVVKEDLHEAA